MQKNCSVNNNVLIILVFVKKYYTSLLLFTEKFYSMESNIFILPTTFITALLSMDKSAGVKRVNIFQDLPLSEDTSDLGLDHKILIVEWFVKLSYLLNNK